MISRSPGSLTAKITRPAPDVRGHRAFWAGPYLIWRYALSGRPALALPYPADSRLATPAQLRKATHQARRIAAHVRYGAATPPLLFPVQLRNLPPTWRVGSVFYLPQGRVFRAERFALTAGNPNLGADGGLEYQPVSLAALFRDHLRLLGARPGRWTARPVT
jgi:hypothetical protein